MRIKRALTTGAMALAMAGTVLAPGSASAAPPAPSDDVSPSIIGGTYGNYGPAARLYRNGRETCSATIIAPQWILTARHCVGSGMTFRIGNPVASQGTFARATNYTNHSADLSLVRLDRSVQASYAQLASSNPTRGNTVNVYGWGATCRGNEAGCQSPRLKTATTTYYGISRDAYGGQALYLYRGNGITAGGDSGGPAVYNGTQVGVASTSNRSTVTNYTSVAAYRSWIRQVAGV
ncbi:S1 family peptidase [Amycolatopsis cihanbeyliensis]|uniref:Trypsin n=1 Tax=Amycolatopsis cihanbeyliensis TaxID=1128664 RepID=A0A542DKN9_AMYCI|nr:trypsin-like serine protease [Amycolatopsis cihanbeyliensis]TQJ03633.1 trypsin [Amycolatopsis cihanbeyliensis]